jgi:hypothetical protein
MSTTHLVYATGNIFIPHGPTEFQIGPTLDVRKYSRIRVVARDFTAPFGDINIHFRVKEGNVVIELPTEVVLFGPGAHHASKVIDVPGRDLEIFVRDFPAPPFAGKRLEMFVFGLEL